MSSHSTHSSTQKPAAAAAATAPSASLSAQVHSGKVKSVTKVVRICNTCGKEFKYKRNFEKHTTLCGNKPKCEKCGRTFHTIEQRDNHLTNAHEENIQRFKCKECKQSFCNRKQLYVHQGLYHGGAHEDELEVAPWRDHPPWIDDAGNVNNELHDVFRANRRHILAHHRLAGISSTYNFPTSNLSGGINELTRHLRVIYEQENESFKINLSFGVVLRQVETGAYRYFVPYDNNTVFPSPISISSHRDLNRMIEKLRGIDLDNYYTLNRPNTKWVAVMVTNVNYFVSATGYHLGKGFLPDFIKNHKCIIGLDANREGKPWGDDLCAFRCLALHFGQCDIESAVRIYYEKWRVYLLENLEKEIPIDPLKYTGVSLDMLSELEVCFAIALYVFEVKEEPKTVTLLYKPSTNHKDIMYLNLYQHHLSYITNFKGYAKKFQCQLCEKCFPRMYDYKRHIAKCTSRTKYIYKGGFYSNNLTIFERLEEVGIVVPKEDRMYEYFSVLDAEALLLKADSGSAKKSRWVHEHKIISVSVCSNVPGFDKPKCFLDPDSGTLVQSMIYYLHDIQGEVERLMREKWRTVLDQLDKLKQRWSIEEEEEEREGERSKRAKTQDTRNDGVNEVLNIDPDSTGNDSISDNNTNSDIDSTEETDSNASENESVAFDYDSDNFDIDDEINKILGNERNTSDTESDEDVSDDSDKVESRVQSKASSHMKKHIEKLTERFLTYIKVMPVQGFNSARYDLNLMKKHILKELNLDGAKAFVIKRNNSYVTICTDRLQFLDICQFLVPGVSYAQFLAAYKVPMKKGVFCYDYLDSEEKLKDTSLPAYEAFFSSVKNRNISREEYEEAQNVWKEQNMETLADFLIYYNNLDVGPFVEGVSRLQKFYFDRFIDVFKIAVSAPGVARRMLFEAGMLERAHFPTMGAEDEDLYLTFKKNLVGGPAIVFCRHHKKGETKIRGGNKKCQRIVGYDSNALYLHAISRPMPTGTYVRRREENGFFPTKHTRYQLMYIWLEWESEKNNMKIIHALNNNGREVRIGPYLVDGYYANENLIMEFYGCYFHGCNCIANVMPEKERKQKLKRTHDREKFLTTHGYKIISKWECQFRKDIDNDSELKSFSRQFFPDFFKLHPGQVSTAQILNGVQSGTLFGMVEVDIEVPEEWDNDKKFQTSPLDYFSEMCPLFCTVNIGIDDIGEHMKTHIKTQKLSEKPRKLLVSGLRARKMLLFTPLLKWYIEHGLKVTRVYQVVEFIPKPCFKKFEENVTHARRQGDLNPNEAIIADTMKLIGNSAYGGIIMQKERQHQVKYYSQKHKAVLAINSPRFRKVTEIDEDFFEIESAKAQIRLDLPIYLGYAILQYAKLQMVSFYYDCLDYYVRKDDYEYVTMDTDSAYIALSSENIKDVIIQEKRKQFHDEIYERCSDSLKPVWFMRECCEIHRKHDKRFPGIMKEEASGDEIIALSSKTYVLNTKEQKDKLSCKGINKASVQNPLAIFSQVLKTGTTQEGNNKGFRAHNNTIYTYEQKRAGFSYLYCKRKVLNNGVTTLPLQITLSPWEVPDLYVFGNYSDPLSPAYSCTLVYGKNFFFSAEHLFSYRMAIFHNVPAIAQAIQQSKTMPDVISYAKMISPSFAWFQVRSELMKEVLLLKMRSVQNVRYCLAHNLPFVFASPKDKYWGVGMSKRVALLSQEDEFRGRNMLGSLWNDVRNCYKDEFHTEDSI